MGFVGIKKKHQTFLSLSVSSHFYDISSSLGMNFFKIYQGSSLFAMGLQPSKSSACRVRTRMAKVHTTDLKRSWKIVGKIRCRAPEAPKPPPTKKKGNYPVTHQKWGLLLRFVGAFVFLAWLFSPPKSPWSTAWLSSSGFPWSKLFPFLRSRRPPTGGMEISRIRKDNMTQCGMGMLTLGDLQRMMGS